MTDADLSAYSLGRCRRCRRILLTAHLEKGRCRPGNDCGAHEAMRLAWEDGHPDAIAFARAVEVALYGQTNAEGAVPGMPAPGEAAAGTLEGRQQGDISAVLRPLRREKAIRPGVVSEAGRAGGSAGTVEGDPGQGELAWYR